MLVLTSKMSCKMYNIYSNKLHSSTSYLLSFSAVCLVRKKINLNNRPFHFFLTFDIMYQSEKIRRQVWKWYVFSVRRYISAQEN